MPVATELVLDTALAVPVTQAHRSTCKQALPASLPGQSHTGQLNADR